MRDSLGDRIKENYENRTRYFLPRRTYTILRVDGKAFHTYTRSLPKPFDYELIDDINATAQYLCKQIQGAQFAYVQSDEISILVTDFAKQNTDMYFDGNIQKICSVVASMAAARFNQLRVLRMVQDKCDTYTWDAVSGMTLGVFDCRVFTIPDLTEVQNYFVWRNQDASRNSLQMVARHHFSHGECEHKSGNELHEMLHTIGVNWATDYKDNVKNGRLIVSEPQLSQYIGKDGPIDYERNVWVSYGAGVFTQNPKEITDLIPEPGYE